METDLSASSYELIENPEINKLTLELFMNKNQYNKYLSKINPEKHSALENEWKIIQSYRQSILSTTDNLLNDRNLQISTDVNDAFDSFVRTLVRHFQQKELERTDHANIQYNHNDDNDDDQLFGNITPSYWGKERVVKKGGRRGTFDMFSTLPRTNEN